MSQHTNLGNIALPVGSYESDGKTRKRFRNIGTLMKTTENGEERFWLKLNADVFHAALFALVRATGMERGEDAVIATVFAPRDEAKAKPPATPAVPEGDIPF